MARIAWELYDPVLDETYNWEINPNDGGSLNYQKTTTAQQVVAPDGKVILFEGRDDPKSTTVSGVILAQSQFETMVEWFNKRYQVQLTDDLGRVFMIYITNFEPKRVRSSRTPWRHDYSLTFTIVDWVE